MKRNTYLVFIFCLFFTIFRGNATEKLYDPYMPEPLPKGAPEWMKAIDENPSGVNFNEMQRLYQEWTASDVDVRVRIVENKQVVNYFRRWSSAYKKYAQPDGTIQLPTMEEYASQVDAMNASVAKQKRHLKSEEITQIWRNIGPNKTYVQKDGEVKEKDSQVCVFRIAVSLSDKNVLYCGTEKGVVFKTTDHGENWYPCAPLHNFGGSIFSIAIDPQDNNIVYVGGGPWLWKSTDGGDTWKRCEGITNRVNSIRINPDNRKNITISTGDRDNKDGSGFYISDDGGESFFCTIMGICFDHELQPGNPNRIYLIKRDYYGVWTYFYYSTDGGYSWTQSSLPVSFTVCGRLAVSEAEGGEDYVYALVTTSSYGYDSGPFGGKGEPAILLSKDGGLNWEDKTKYDGWGTFSPIMDTAGGQGYFDMMVGASPSDPKKVLFGLTSLYRSTEEGVTNYRNGAIGGYQRSDWMHCDIQDIAIHPDGDTWICNDGGIKYSADFFETKGEDKYRGIYASDYQGLGVGWNEDVMAAGRWHNGDVVHAKSFGEGNSLHVGGVEIATGYVMLSNPWKVYFTDAGTRVLSPEMGGVIVDDYKTWFSDIKPYESLRINGKIATDPRYAQKVFIQDMTNVTEGYLSYDEGASFQKVFDSDGEDFYDYEFARSNPDRVYIIGNFHFWRSDDGGETFKEMEAWPFPKLNIYMYFTKVVVDPNDADHVIAICCNYEGKVVESFDGGESWQDYDLGWLEDKKIHQIILVGDEYNSCYMTSYDGAYVWFKDNTMTEFIDYSTGLPPGARITKVVPFYKDAVLRMATDQGLWEAPLYHQTFRPVAQPMALNLGDGNLTMNPSKMVQFDSYSIVSQDENTVWKWSFSPQPQYVNNTNIRNPQVVFGKAGKYDVTLTVTTPAGTSSRTIEDMIVIDGPEGIDDSELIGEVGVKSNIISQGESLIFITSGLTSEGVVTIHNTKGQLMQSQQVSSVDEEVAINLSNLNSGIYIYSLKTPTQKFFGKFIIK